MIEEVKEGALGGHLYTHDAGKYFGTGFGRRREVAQAFEATERAQPVADFIIVGIGYDELGSEKSEGVPMDSIAGLSALIQNPTIVVGDDAKVLSLRGDFTLRDGAAYNPFIGKSCGATSYGIHVTPGNPPYTAYPRLWLPGPILT